MNLQWSEDLAVGHPDIDRQHQELFKRFEQFLSACTARDSDQQLHQLFDFLSEYVVVHFDTEQRLMENHEYAGKDEHMRQHEEFSQQLGALKEELKRAGATVEILMRTNKALLYWLTSHIRQTDTKLAQFLRET